ncbi:hypothetical protein HDV00_001455 [Rhizophlyctis rosea]|nr:hypothetical protein HDV00_001455 [Rhizophlyctis rosea]
MSLFLNYSSEFDDTAFSSVSLVDPSPAPTDTLPDMTANLTSKYLAITGHIAGQLEAKVSRYEELCRHYGETHKLSRKLNGITKDTLRRLAGFAEKVGDVRPLEGDRPKEKKRRVVTSQGPTKGLDSAPKPADTRLSTSEHIPVQSPVNESHVSEELLQKGPVEKEDEIMVDAGPVGNTGDLPDNPTDVKGDDDVSMDDGVITAIVSGSKVAASSAPAKPILNTEEDTAGVDGMEVDEDVHTNGREVDGEGDGSREQHSKREVSGVSTLENESLKSEPVAKATEVDVPASVVEEPAQIKESVQVDRAGVVNDRVPSPVEEGDKEEGELSDDGSVAADNAAPDGEAKPTAALPVENRPTQSTPSASAEHQPTPSLPVTPAPVLEPPTTTTGAAMDISPPPEPKAEPIPEPVPEPVPEPKPVKKRIISLKDYRKEKEVKQAAEVEKNAEKSVGAAEGEEKKNGEGDADGDKKSGEEGNGEREPGEVVE